MLAAMSVRERSAKKSSKATAKKSAASKSATRRTKKATAKKAPTRKASTKKAATKKAPTRKASTKKASTKKAPTRKASAKKAASGSGGLLPPVEVRRSREDKAWAEARLTEIDQVMSAWGDILALRMVADQTFSEIVEQLEIGRPRDLRGLFLWEALHAAESHIALITEVIATHLSDRRADPVAILEDLRARRTQVAAVYAVNAFLAVLNQMKPTKPKWVQMSEVDPRFAVLALAHQTLRYASEALQVEIPTDFTDQILVATQDDAVWVWRRMPEPGTDTLAACAAAAAFFRVLDSTSLITTDELAAHYAAHGRA